MFKKLRKIPPVCLCIALAKLLTGSLSLPHKYLGAEVKNEEGNVFRAFRNIKMQKQVSFSDTCVFVVSFKFSRLSHSANKLASIIPMLIIAGCPGFNQKIYAVNEENGHWQGMYEWKSNQHLEDYKKSFVFRMMKKRAISESIVMMEYKNKRLSDWLKNNNN